MTLANAVEAYFPTLLKRLIFPLDWKDNGNVNYVIGTCACWRQT